MGFREVPPTALNRYKEALVFGLSVVGLKTGKPMIEVEQRREEKSQGGEKCGREEVGASETMLMKGPECRMQPWAWAPGQTPSRSALMPLLLLSHTEALVTLMVLKCKFNPTPFPMYPTYSEPFLCLPLFLG